MIYRGDIYDKRWYQKNHDEEIYALNPAYQEIFKLHWMLVEHNIPHRIRRCMDGWQVIYPDREDWIMDAIEHCGSYGNNQDKLEIMGLLTPEEEVFDSVVGHLTAEEVFERIQNHYSNNEIKEDLPHTHTDPVLNTHITEIIDDFHKLVEKAKSYGLDIKLTPNSIESLELYFHDDYPNTILVDKEEIGL